MLEDSFALLPSLEKVEFNVLNHERLLTAHILHPPSLSIIVNNKDLAMDEAITKPSLILRNPIHISRRESYLHRRS
jgi:hypothetical protein